MTEIGSAKKGDDGPSRIESLVLVLRRVGLGWAIYGTAVGQLARTDSLGLGSGHAPSDLSRACLPRGGRALPERESSAGGSASDGVASAPRLPVRSRLVRAASPSRCAGTRRARSG